MKRAIKFRGKQCDNGEWVFGIPIRYIRNNRSDRWTMHDGRGKEYDIDENTIGQFTGLYDRESVEIYEGDILRLEISNPSGIKKEPRLRKVVWNGFGFSIVNKFGDCICDKVCSCEHLEYTVIGNIYDNPELLKGGVL